MRLAVPLIATLLVAALALLPGQSEARDSQSTIAFSRGGFLHFMAPDGSRVRSAGIALDAFPVWSPDGTAIAFASGQDKAKSALYIAKADGTGRRRLSRFLWLDCLWVGGWSPDGKTLVYTDNEGGCDGSLAIYRVNADGSGTKRLRNGNQHLDPAWSPDGRSILYTSYRRFPAALFVADPTGRQPQRIPGTATIAHNGRPSRPPSAWSRDGKRVFFLREGARGASVHVVNVDGTRRRNLTPTLEVESFAISPSRTRLAICVNTGRHFRTIYVMNTDGKAVRRLTGDRLDAVDPQWSPDGTEIVFVGRERGTKRETEIYVIDAAGGTARNISRSPGADLAPAWSPRS